MSEITQRIKDALPIADVIGDYISLKRKGVNMVGMCPFHDDRTPSLIVSPAKNMYKCFACGTAGDSIEFVKQHEAVSFPEALRILGRKAGIEVREVEQTPEERKASLERESMQIVLSAVWNLYQSQLATHQPALAYNARRGITIEVATEFGLGYAQNGNFLLDFADKHGYKREYLQKLGLVKKNERGQWYDAFRNRIIYPFFDISGRVVGFTGRHLDWKKGDNFAKFLNSDESPLFHKDRILFGLSMAKREIAKLDRAYLVEGQNDVISLYCAGIKNAVCASGTAFSDNQAKLLRRFTENVTLMYDGDDAGHAASEKAIEVLLRHGFNVRAVKLEDGVDPDDFTRNNEKKDLKITVSNLETDFVNYLLAIHADKLKDVFEKTKIAKQIAGLISLMPAGLAKGELLSTLSRSLKIDIDELKPEAKAKAEIPDTWENGIYGMDTLREQLKKNKELAASLTFRENSFMERYDSEPIVYVRGKISKEQIHQLRILTNELDVERSEYSITFDYDEPEQLSALKDLFFNGIKINMYAVGLNSYEDEVVIAQGFVDYYVQGYSRLMATTAVTENTKAEYIDRCAVVISFAENTVRTVMMKSYAKNLGLTATDLEKIVKPYVQKRNDKTILENQRLDVEAELFQFDPENVPAYVTEDEQMNKMYMREGYFPILNKDKEPVAYMFRNEKGSGLSNVSDFYMKPLLHVRSKDSMLNKRVIQLNHIHEKPRYVEWQSSILATLGKVKEKLVEEGSYNYWGSMQQFQRIWKQMSYNFITCTELKVFGQQPEGFWAFSNAIVHETDDELKIQHIDELGIVQHKEKNFYLPAFSNIFLDERRDSDPYEQDRYFIYKETPENMRIDFEQWAKLMNEVYQINDNGKWAILFDILACFRDFIYQEKRFFTTLFFIGPTSSGKSQIAYSMRSLFMSPDAPVFNLNSGTDAAFFMVLERTCNVIAIMEEYNDTNISQAKFQGLKSAVLDGEGKIKVKDMSSKTLDSSKINAIPLPLGQEAPQQDDGSLSNRSIICEVPYKAKGDWSDEEMEIFNRLKRHENAGLCNVLIEVLAIRKVVKKYFIPLFDKEVKAIKNHVNISVSNTEGLARIINSVGMVSAMCKLIEEHTTLKLPFTYKDFFVIACEKVLKQVEMISTSNKLSNYFSTISFLLNQGSLQIGKELKVSVPKGGTVTVKASGNTTEQVNLENPETKVLYIDFGAIYPLYAKAVKDPLSKASLQTYFNSNQAYIGLCKSTEFKWFEEQLVPEKDEYTDTVKINRKYVTHKNNTSAYMFKYDELKYLMDIDYERTGTTDDEEQPEVKEEDKPF